MDIPALTKLLDYGLLGVLLILAIYAIVYLYKKVMEVQEKRISESNETTKTVTVALNSVAQHTENVESTMKAILISLEKNNGQK